MHFENEQFTMQNAEFRKWFGADNCAFGLWQGVEMEQIESCACNLFRQCGGIEKFLRLQVGRIGQLTNLDGLVGEWECAFRQAVFDATV